MSDTEKLTNAIEESEARRLRMAAMEVELTPQVERRLMKYARGRERWLIASGVRGAEGAAAAWVADAIGDTLVGTVAWSGDVPLSLHLYGVIRGRTSWLRRQARARPHPSIDDPDRGRSTRREMIAARGVTAHPEDVRIAAEQTARVVAYVEVAAANDPAVLALLRAYQGGAEALRDVVAAGVLTAADASRARKRLDRMLARMPAARDEDDLSSSGTW